MRWTAAGLVAAVVLGVCGVTAAPAGAATAERCDVDGDGTADLAIGVPGEDGAGAVNVQYSSGLPGQLLTHDWLERGWAYGSVLTCGDFDADGVGDLVVGAPGAFDGEGLAFWYGGTAGAALGPTWMPFGQGAGPGVPGLPEPGDRFGSALAAGDLTGDGIDDLVVGVPGDRTEELWRSDRHGSVVVVPGSPADLAFADPGLQLFPWAEFDDEEFRASAGFGTSVAVGQFVRGGAAELAVGAPRVSPRSQEKAKITFEGGRVYTFGASGERLAGTGVLHQDDSELWPGQERYDRFGVSLAAGDLDGDGDADLAVGVPNEEIDGERKAGSVSVFGGGPGGIGTGGSTSVTQLAAGGAIEGPDGFGQALAIGDTTGDGRADLVVGAPWEEVRGLLKAGAVSVFPGDASLVTAGTTVTGDRAEDRLGRSVAVVGGDAVAGKPGLAGPAALPGGMLAGGVLQLADGSTLHQDSPGVADSREVSWSLMPEDDTPGEGGSSSDEPTGEWFGWAVAG